MLGERREQSADEARRSTVEEDEQELKKTIETLDRRSKLVGKLHSGMSRLISCDEELRRMKFSDSLEKTIGHAKEESIRVRRRMYKTLKARNTSMFNS